MIYTNLVHEYFLQEYYQTLQYLKTSIWTATLPINPTPVIFYDQPFVKGKNVKSSRAGLHYIDIDTSYINDCSRFEAMDVVYLPMICNITNNDIKKIVVYHSENNQYY